MHATRGFLMLLSCSLSCGCDDGRGATAKPKGDPPVVNRFVPPRLPAVGDANVSLLSADTLELTLVTTKNPDPARVGQWDFIDDRGHARLPSPQAFEVLADGKPVRVEGVGFKRRVLYAPLKQRDLRIANCLYLRLATPVSDEQDLQVISRDQKLWPAEVSMRIKAEPRRWSPVLHVNQTGYLPGQPKIAMVGYFLGSLGELRFGEGSAAPRSFAVLESGTGREVFKGELKRRPDQGFPFRCYQRVFEADFSALKKPGQYQLFVAGLGCSYPFLIDEGIAACFARTFALGLYHQRCGTANELPFTRFVHQACHLRPAEVPDNSDKFKAANESLAKETANFKDNPRHTARQLKNMAAGLYPFARNGGIDVTGGHHDAGDYSKYTINSAGFIHHLVFAADAFPGVSELDNLGLPESGDGKSDVLQEAKWEADFLLKMQDRDGGFYFLVYPREREYETDVTPDHGDPQIVFPKTTAATAAAVAALAQCAASPAFKRQFPESARAYLEAAKAGWDFLGKAFAQHGKDGSYQKITHYGDEFMHDDELAWAACELFLATRESAYEKKLADWLRPADPATKKWGWLRLCEAYGCAIRSYAFGARSGRVRAEQLNPLLLQACENELAAAGEEHAKRANENAYGTSFPAETKRSLSAGWYFAADAAFDLAVACQLPAPQLNDQRPAMRAAIFSNLNYEQGCNPVNVTYVTGLGCRRQREIVHQYAQNDRRIMPPTGVPLGNIQAGLGWNYLYGKELDVLSYPPDGDQRDPYPFYDRWSDGFNLTQEFVILHQARALGYLCWIMAQTPLKTQPWKAAAAEIPALGRADRRPELKLELNCAAFDLSSARVIWEVGGLEPTFGKTLTVNPETLTWVEAEAQMPDGRRVFGVWERAR